MWFEPIPLEERAPLGVHEGVEDLKRAFAPRSECPQALSHSRLFLRQQAPRATYGILLKRHALRPHLGQTLKSFQPAWDMTVLLGIESGKTLLPKLS